ncbi:retrovirus-related pol polyprotein from transposon TNT 1-94 [Tanacetum coccineum]|uniref:Retrovirus-related pol polyprotein from transposon TNT 1-94 n=2 Tax=Tanacetum coccineum TaxID=301880 RepID=A0ABQ5CVW8_9ASTR
MKLRQKKKKKRNRRKEELEGGWFRRHNGNSHSYGFSQEKRNNGTAWFTALKKKDVHSGQGTVALAWMMRLTVGKESMLAMKNGRHHYRKDGRNQNDVKVKQIRTDNEIEFRNHELESFCDEKGISQNFSSPYTPEQNGVAERKSRTLIEAARTMLNGLVLSKHDRWSRDQHIELVNIINDSGEGMLSRIMAAKLTASLTSECLFADFLSEIEPKKVSEALKHPGWVDAMHEELNLFYRNKVWTLVPLPYGKIAINSKWVFKNKKDEHGITTKNKARLVAQGYSQDEGFDYDETFAPVARMEAIRIFLAFATYMHFKVYQIDVKSAFLNGKLKKKFMSGQLMQLFSSVIECSRAEVHNPAIVDITHMINQGVQALGFQYHFLSDDKSQQLVTKLYVGNVIKNTSAIVIPDSEETLMLAKILVLLVGPTKVEVRKNFYSQHGEDDNNSICKS